MKIENVVYLDVAGVDRQDYPDFCDAYFTYGVWKNTGKELTDEELEILTDQNPEVLNEMAYESYLGI